MESHAVRQEGYDVIGATFDDNNHIYGDDGGSDGEEDTEPLWPWFVRRYNSGKNTWCLRVNFEYIFGTW